MEKKIRVGITHGDINGISYEVILKTLANEDLTELCTPIVFGSGKVAGYYRKMLNLEEVKLNTIANASLAKDGCVNMVNITQQELKIEPGVATAESGKAAVAALDMAMQALDEGAIDVLVTAPVNKEAMQLAEFGFTGHTEYLESKAGEGAQPTMTFVDDKLRVALLTTHLPMTQVPASVTSNAITEKIREIDKSMRRDFGCDCPLIAVLALNPHAGDGGLLGDEENQIIKPTVDELYKEGIMAFGPYPADGFFGSGMWERFDAVLAMYHDQGLVGFKALSAGEGVNCTCGLPFVRTSPDHGTGYDIVTKGLADPTSFRNAIFTAIDIFRSRKNFDDAEKDPLKHFVAEKHDRRHRNKPMRGASTELRMDVKEINAEVQTEELDKETV